MTDGITIINTTYAIGTLWVIILMAVCTAIMLTVAILVWIQYGFDAYPVFITGILFVLLIVLIITYQPPVAQYQVILDDNVSMNEFYQYYRVIRQEGISYIVELIENGL